MKNVLVVDDEETLLLIMVNRFEDYADQFNVFTARNGKEAVEVLESESIDFLVTDLKMPEMDGIELLALMSSKYSHIPAMAMSAFSTPEIEKKLAKMGTLRVLDKPVNFDMLAEAIIRGLEQKAEGGSINCVSVSSFLQLIKMEDKTCMLEVHSHTNERGFLYIRHGDLLDAECGDLKGEEAALEIIAWDSQQLFIKDLPRGIKENKINKGLMSVVMDGLRLKDERDAAMAEASGKQKTGPADGEESVVDDDALNFELDEPDFSVDEVEPAAGDTDIKFELDDSELDEEQNGDANFGFDVEEESDTASTAPQSAAGENEIQFELDESEPDGTVSENHSDFESTDELVFELEEEGKGDEFLQPDTAPSPGADEPNVAENADLQDSQESIFGDADIDFSLDGAESSQEAGDDSGLNFELDGLDGIAAVAESLSGKQPPSSEPVETAAGNAQTGAQDGLDDIGFDELIAGPPEEQSAPADESGPATRSVSDKMARKPEAAERKIRQVGSIEKIFRSLNSEQQLNKVLNSVLKTLQQVVPFDLAVLMTRQLNNPEHLQIEEIVVRGAVKSVQYNRIPYRGAELDAVMQKGKSLIVEDTGRLKGALEKKMFCKHGLTSCLLIPLSINGAAAGVLTLGARNHGIFKRTRQYVEWVGNGIALAIERDRLALESRKRKLALNITMQVMQALIAMKFDIAKVLQLVFSLIQKQLDVEAGFVYEMDGTELMLVNGFKPDGKSVKKQKLAPEDGIAWQVVKEGTPILVNDMSQLPQTYNESKGLFDFKTRSVLSVPIRFDDDLTGVIEVRNKRQKDYNAEDEMLMQAIGAAVGIVIESTRCYKKKKARGQQEKEVMASLQKIIGKTVEQAAAV